MIPVSAWLGERAPAGLPQRVWAALIVVVGYISGRVLGAVVRVLPVGLAVAVVIGLQIVRTG